MRVGNLAGRLVLVTDAGAIDVETASGGRFGADPQAVYERWPEFREWASGATATDARPFRVEDLGAPAPRPAQVFAIGLNYGDHVEEAELRTPEWPLIFTKFPSSFGGPTGEIELPTGAVDWEVELVFVMGRRAEHVSVDRAWDHIAGLTIGQDLSEREVQLRGDIPQMGVAKSLPGFSPTGPFLVTPDSFENPDDLAIGCTLNGETMQSATTANLLISVPALVELLSAWLPLLPGDVVFTGTMAGVGISRTPPRLLRPGDELVSQVEGIGEMTHTFTSKASADSLQRDADAAVSRLKEYQAANARARG